MLVIFFSTLVQPCDAHRTKSIHNNVAVLAVRENEFVTLHIGNPGTSVVFWLRWDLSGIYLRPDAELSRFSRTYNEPTSSDIFCFGLTCARMPFTLTYSLPSPQDSFHVGVTLQNYRGVLGLAENSPIWEQFRYRSYNPNELVLSNTPIGLLKNDGVMDECIAGNYVPISLNGINYWALIEMSTDYSFMPFWLVGSSPETEPSVPARESSSLMALFGDSSPQTHWRLGLFGRKYSLRIDRALIHESNTDGVTITTLRPISSRVLANRAQRVAALNELLPDWNATDMVILGRYFLSAGFTVVSDMLTGQTALSLHWVHKPWLVASDYQWFYAVFISLAGVWIYVVLDGVDHLAAVDVSMSLGRAEEPHMRAHATYETVLSVPVEKIEYPPALVAAQEWGVTSTSIRNPGFMRALSFVSCLACVTLLCCIIFGYGFMHQFWHHHFTAHDKAALYSSFGVLAFYLVGMPLTPLFPSMGAVWGQCAIMLCIWLVSMMDHFSYSAIIMLTLSSSWGAIQSCHQWLDVASGRIWPARVYSRTPLAWFSWFCLATLMAAWWIWVFCFYTVPLVLRGWQNDHLAEWSMAILTLSIVIGVAYRNAAREFAIRTNLRITASVAVSARNRLALLNIHSQIQSIKRQLQAPITTDLSPPTSVMTDRRKAPALVQPK